MSNASPTPEQLERLKEFKDCNRQVRKDGFIFGGCALFISGLFSHRLLNLSRNSTILATLAATGISTYMFAAESSRQCMVAKIKAKEMLDLARATTPEDNILSDDEIKEMS